MGKNRTCAKKIEHVQKKQNMCKNKMQHCGKWYKMEKKRTCAKKIEHVQKKRNIAKNGTSWMELENAYLLLFDKSWLIKSNLE